MKAKIPAPEQIPVALLKRVRKITQNQMMATQKTPMHLPDKIWQEWPMNSTVWISSYLFWEKIKSIQ